MHLAPKARRIAHSANSRSADEWVTALYNSRASFLATTAVPEDPAEAIRGGLVLTPLLGCKARTPLDWTHAWAMLGEWAGTIAFPILEPLGGRVWGSRLGRQAWGECTLLEYGARPGKEGRGSLDEIRS